MNRLLLFFNILTILAGPVIIVMGHLAIGGHKTFGFLYAILLIGTVVLTMFYFITTGSSIKQWVKEYDLDPQLYKETKVFKKNLFPFLFLSSVFAVGTGIYGGAVDAGMEPGWLHGLWAYISWGLFLFAFTRFSRSAQQNRLLMEKVYNLIQTPAESDQESKSVSEN